MDNLDLGVLYVGHVFSDNNHPKRTFWIAREAHRTASEAAAECESGQLLCVSFDVCVEQDYIEYSEEGNAKAKQTLNVNLRSTSVTGPVRLLHMVDPQVSVLDPVTKRLYRVTGRVTYRVK